LRTSGCDEWREANVNTSVRAQRTHKGCLHLGIEMIFASAPAHALQALAGGLLLEHRESDELAHAGDFGVERGDFVAGRGRGAIAEVCAGIEAD
jgi:hypothetical protein